MSTSHPVITEETVISEDHSLTVVPFGQTIQLSEDMNVYNGIDTYTITFKDYLYNSNNIKSFDKKMNILGNYILL